MIGSTKQKIGFLMAVISLVSLVQSSVLYAQTVTPTAALTPTPTPDKSKQLNDVQNKISELEQKVSQLQSEEKSLSSQIQVMDSQMKLTEYRIDATQQEIRELEKDISAADNRINNLEGSLEDITKVLMNRIVATYQIGTIQPLQILLSSDDVGNFLTRANYLRIAQAHDKKLIYNTVQARNDYENQKEIFEEKRGRVLSLKTELEGYTDQLEKDKQAKQDLLRVTKNDEQRYQQLLSAAIAERSAIQGVVNSLRLQNGSPVEAGQAIATMGNSGAPYCSTGAHLHFEVRVGGTIVDPSGYLSSGGSYSYSYDSSQYGYYGSVNPTGSWDWPMKGNILIHQGYGSHGFAQSFYPDGRHTGIDMTSSATTIYTPKSGTLYRGSTSCRGAAMNYVAVDHGDNIVSWYWHVQ